MTLPRILYAVPPALETRLAIIKAIRALGEHDEAERLQKGKGTQKQVSASEIAAEIARQVFRELRKAGFNPNEPRVPAGNPDGGEWTREDGDSTGTDTRVLSDATPDDNWIPGGQYAANDPPGIGHNQGPPLEDPPEILPNPPSIPQAITGFLKTAAYWLASAVARADKRVALFLAALAATWWLVNKYLPYVIAYQDPPKTWEELQQNALRKRPGYDIHHPVEQTPARDDGFSDSVVDGPENRLSIPRLKHWQINGWYGRANPQFKDQNDDDISPRDYLRGKSWEERMRVGKEALILYGVLKP
jgi:hypothetical protein